MAKLLSSASCCRSLRLVSILPAAKPLNARRRLCLVASSRGASNSSCSSSSPGIGTSRREVVLGVGSLLALGVASDGETRAEAACATLTVAPNGLAFCDTSVGQGVEASKGLLIKAHYTGRLEDGTVFDSSYNRGKPLVFRVGVGEVIKGWDQGITGAQGIPPMLAGGKRTLRIPPELGYGDRGAGCRGGSCIIPPKAVLIFDVEFVGKA